MLQYFFNIPVQEDGRFDEEERSKRHQILSQLKIGTQQEIMEGYFGQYPVIFICFKDIKGVTYEDIEAAIRDLIYKLYAAHRYFLRSDKLDDIQKEHFRKFITKKFNLSELKDSLYSLSEMLFAHFGKKVVILIDEYDTPKNDLYAKKLAREGKPSEEDDLYLEKILLLLEVF